MTLPMILSDLWRSFQELYKRFNCIILYECQKYNTSYVLNQLQVTVWRHTWAITLSVKFDRKDCYWRWVRPVSDSQVSCLLPVELAQETCISKILHRRPGAKGVGAVGRLPTGAKRSTFSAECSRANKWHYFNASFIASRVCHKARL